MVPGTSPPVRHDSAPGADTPAPDTSARLGAQAASSCPDAAIDLLKQSLHQNNAQNARLDELLWAATFSSVTAKSTWLKDKSFAPGRWALGYPALYILYRILNEKRPKHILELGMGQSTRMIAQYTRHYKKVEHTVVEHDPDWVTFCQKDCALCERSSVVLLEREMVPFREAASVRVFRDFAEAFKDQSFDFICIDAPLGGDMKDYARIDVLRLLPGILEKSFILLLDDYNRPGEQKTAAAMEAVLQSAKIAYTKGAYSGLKTTLILCSQDNRFFTSL